MEQTLPYSWYADPESSAASRSGSSAGPGSTPGTSGELPEPGTFFSARAGRTPVVVTRARDGELRALPQRLPAPRLPGRRGRGEARDDPVPVPRLDVRARRLAALGAAVGRGAGLPKDELGLCRVAVDTWGPFVFVNTGRDPEPLADALGSMPAQVAELGLDVDALVFYTRWETEVAANWKVVCENFLECYHCQVAHPQLAEMLDVSAEAYALSTDGRLSSQRDADPRERPRTRMQLEGELPRSQFHFLWPNLEREHLPRPAEHLDRADACRSRPTARTASSTTSSARTSTRSGSTS